MVGFFGVDGQVGALNAGVIQCIQHRFTAVVSYHGGLQQFAIHRVEQQGQHRQRGQVGSHPGIKEPGSQ